MRKNVIIGLVQLFLASVSAIYVESVSAGRILFIDSLLSSSATCTILAHPLRVITGIGLISLVTYLISHQRDDKGVINNICKSLFDDFVLKKTKIDASKLRLSFFTVERKVRCRLKYPFLTYKNRLVLKGRAQQRQQIKRTRITFDLDEGCIGAAYTTGILVKQIIPEYDSLNPARYYRDSEERLGLSSRRVKMLNDKACEFLCIPVRYFTTHLIYGIIIIDSIKNGEIEKIKDIRDIELVLQHFGAFFAPIKS